MEIVIGLLIAYLFSTSIPSTSLPSPIQLLELFFKVFFITVLTIIFLTDFKKMLIPDRIIWPAMVTLLIWLISLTLYKIGYLYFYLSQSLVGRLLLPPHSPYFIRHTQIMLEQFFFSILTALFLAGFYLALITITRGKGMGGGDVKLGAFMGLGLGFPNAVLATFLSFLTGAAVAIFLIILGKKKFGQNLPFGPFLVLGSLVALFWGNLILNWYLTLNP